MTWAIITKIEALLGELKAALPAPVQAEVKAAENEVHDVIHTAEDYIKAHALQDLATLAVTFVSAMVPGGSWSVMLGALKAQAITNGIALVDGAEAVVAAKVQADLIATGKLPAPVPAA